MSREKEDKGDMEMTVYGCEIDDVELDPRKKEVWILCEQEGYKYERPGKISKPKKCIGQGARLEAIWHE